MTDIEFEVIGLPAPQGSKTRMPNGAMLEGGSKEARTRHRDWRTAVAERAREVAAGHGLESPLDGPLALEVEFRFPMPASRPKRTRTLGLVPKSTAPDLDKLVRSVGDSLTQGGLIRDDARIYLLLATKVETVGWTGATIRVKDGRDV